ncbi:MAG TPA: helicase-related protein [Micromonosporaceae bacterium]|nr:helicase-related protein [Micromonosporaceae bacterium]
MAAAPTGFAPGSLIAARGREWVVLPDSSERFLVARPLSGDTEYTTGLFPHEARPASFPRPTGSPNDIGDHLAAGLLRTALRIGFTSSAGPFRCLASIAVEPRQYQLVPLLIALRMPTVRLLIGDDVGIGKTIEAALIAKELLEQGEARRLTVLCSPALAEQWQGELADKFAIDATLVLPSTITRLERDLPQDESVFNRHPYTVVSTDFIKSDRRRAQFARTCPDLVIVDEAHTCVGTSGGRARHQRHELLAALAADHPRHLILVTATPHSGDENAFRSLIELIDPKLAHLDLDHPRGRTELARHFVQRRRRDIRTYLDEDTPFPRDRQVREVEYRLGRDYAAFTRAVLDYARTTVRDSGGGLRQRVRWWSALALLRSVASSPRAAAATLLTRSVSAAAETTAEADELGRAGVLDLADDTIEGADAPPGADDEELPRSARDRLRSFARQAQNLEGLERDAKLTTLIREVKALLADGYDPIVFCRFIPTAEYVAEHLAKALGKKASVAAVTGLLPPAERIARIDDLTGQPGRHVLIATDCLSEGVNLQEHFQAVIHYDLAWNPTRHEQREGRVDRFGQRRSYVRAVTLYGLDNAIDGVVLDVLIRKHRTIARQTGVAVPVPETSDTVIQALVEGLLLRHEDPEQLALDLDFNQHRDALHREWESAAERESKALTKYAQSGVKLDEVAREVAAIREALGSHHDIARFVRDTLTGFRVPVRVDKDALRVPTHALPAGIRQAFGLASDDTKTSTELVLHYDLPTPSGEHALVRTDPAVAALARHVLETALDPHTTSPAARCGVTRTTAVTARTILLLVRYRFHLTLPGQAATRTLVAEDAHIVAYRPTADGSREWLPDEAAAALLTADPDANVLPELVTRTIERALAELDAVQPDLDDRGQQLAEELLDAHRRVRAAVGARLAGLKVAVAGNADVLGVYVYLPAGGAR